MTTNPYEPPREPSRTAPLVASTDDDLALLAPPAAARIASASALVGGLFWFVLAFQTALSFRVVVGLTVVLVLVMLVEAAAQLAGSASLRRLRARGAFVLMALGAAGFALAAFWLVYALVHGVLSLVALLHLPLSIATATFAAASLADAKRADAARARLRSVGFESSF